MDTTTDEREDGVGEPQELTACARHALAEAGQAVEAIWSVEPDGHRFVVHLDGERSAAACEAAWRGAGYRVTAAPRGILDAALEEAGERPAGGVRLRVEPPVRVPDGLDRPTRLTDDQLRELRERARQEAGPFVNPAIVSRPGPPYHSREWAEAVIGFRLEQLDWPTTYLLHLAMQAEPEPPLTPARAAEHARRAEAAQRAEAERATRAQRYAAQDREDERRWRELVAACPVEIEVRPNIKGSRRIRDGRSIGQLRHAVPTSDAVSGRGRLHRAGRALCEQTRERQLGEPVDAPATCVSCVKYVPLIRPVDQRPGTTS